MFCPVLPRFTGQKKVLSICDSVTEKAKYGKMRQVNAVNGSQMVVKIGAVYYRGVPVNPCDCLSVFLIKVSGTDSVIYPHGEFTWILPFEMGREFDNNSPYVVHYHIFPFQIAVSGDNIRYFRWQIDCNGIPSLSAVLRPVNTVAIAVVIRQDYTIVFAPEI